MTSPKRDPWIISSTEPDLASVTKTNTEPSCLSSVSFADDELAPDTDNPSFTHKRSDCIAEAGSVVPEVLGVIWTGVLGVGVRKPRQKMVLFAGRPNGLIVARLA